MKITKYGVVILTETEGPKVEGWLYSREPGDPVDATNEELLLELVIPWARKKFEDAVTNAVLSAWREKARQLKKHNDRGN